MSIGTCSVGVQSVRLTPIWQLAIFPIDPVYCRCTPGDSRPCFRKPVSSITHALIALARLHRVHRVPRRELADRAVLPLRLTDEVQQVIVRALRRLWDLRGCRRQRLDALALVLAEDPHRVQRERRTTALFSETRADLLEVALQATDARRVQLVGHAPRVSRLAPNGKVSCSSAKNNKKVFIVHGHDENAKTSVENFLLHRLKLEPVILHLQPNAGRTIIEKLEEEAEPAVYAVILLTPDDEGCKQGAAGPQPRARQNVIFEHGYFVGRLKRKNVCALYKPGVELPSDLHGVLYIEMDDAHAWQRKLANEMQHAGLSFNAVYALAQ